MSTKYLQFLLFFGLILQNGWIGVLQMRVIRWLLSILFVVLLVMAAVFLWRHFHKTDVTVKKPSVTISTPTTKPKSLPGDTSSSSGTASSTERSSTSSTTPPTTTTTTSGNSASSNGPSSASTSPTATPTTAAGSTKLSATGPEDTLWVFAGATIAGTIGYQIVLRRRQTA